MSKLSEKKTAKKAWQNTAAGYLGLLCTGFLAGILGGPGAFACIERAARPAQYLIVLALMLFIAVLAFQMQVIVHEGGHLLFGLLCGYRFLSFRIGSLMLIKTGEGFRIRRFTLKGTGGQCLMIPPERKRYRNGAVCYNLGGIVLNGMLSVLFLILYLLYPDMPFLSFFLFAMAFTGLFIAWTNGVPKLRMGLPNDGSNAVSVKRDEAADRALNLQLTVSAELAEGFRIRDLPKEWFLLPEDADLSDPLICGTLYLECCRYGDLHEFQEASGRIRQYLREAPGLTEIHKYEMRCDLLYYELLGECRKEEIEALCTEGLNKYRKMTSSYLSRIRLAYAYALLAEEDEQTALGLKERFDKQALKYPYSGEAQSEREYMDAALEAYRCRSGAGRTV